MSSNGDIGDRLKRLKKDLETIKKGRENAQGELDEISEVLDRLLSGQTRHKKELDQEQKRQDDMKKRP